MIKLEFSGTPDDVFSDMKAMLSSHAVRAPAALTGWVTPSAPETAPEAVSEPDADTSVAARLYGKAEEGKTRRTKVQIAEDEEIDTLAEKLGVKIAGAIEKHPASAILDQLRAKAAETPDEEPAAISSGEERVDPEDTAVGEATREDVRDAMARYVEKHGMPAIQKNGPELLGYDKLSQIPDDSAAFAAAVARLDEATNA